MRRLVLLLGEMARDANTFDTHSLCSTLLVLLHIENQTIVHVAAGDTIVLSKLLYIKHGIYCGMLPGPHPAGKPLEALCGKLLAMI